jgi:uncharacterized secreted repeat protein (TIGR03808 family)
MDSERRKLIKWSGAASALAPTVGSTLGSALGSSLAFAPPAAAAAAPAASVPISAFGLDATQLGVRPGSPDDQTIPLQRAIDRAAQARVPLALPPGVYRAGGLRLPSGAALIGVRGATRLAFTGGASLLAAAGAETVSLTGITLDGLLKPLPPNQGLVHFEESRGVRIADCAILASGRHGIRFAGVAGEVTGSTIADAVDVALLSSNANGLTVAGNTVTNAGNNAIVIIRDVAGHDGTMVLDNRIQDTRNRDGGSGQFGNAVNAHRAGDVIVRGNLIRRSAFSGVRGNSASAMQIVGNTVHECGEVALYSEFAFEGAIIANNVVDGAVTGVSIANFNEGGRLAAVQGNIFRNPAPRNPDPGELLGIGIYVEADTAVNGNVVDGAEAAGIVVGWGRYLRDVVVTGNVVRKTPIGVAVSVVPGAGSALISANMLSQTARAVVGMDHARPVTGDLTRDGAKGYAHLSVSGNRVG